jgi:hypothetical protein
MWEILHLMAIPRRRARVSNGHASAAAKRLLHGKQYLRYATPIPVVMEKCVMCHPSWKGEKGID